MFKVFCHDSYCGTVFYFLKPHYATMKFCPPYAIIIKIAQHARFFVVCTLATNKQKDIHRRFQSQIQQQRICKVVVVCAFFLSIKFWLKNLNGAKQTAQNSLQLLMGKHGNKEESLYKILNILPRGDFASSFCCCAMEQHRAIGTSSETVPAG